MSLAQFIKCDGCGKERPDSTILITSFEGRTVFVEKTGFESREVNVPLHFCTLDCLDKFLKGEGA